MKVLESRINKRIAQCTSEVNWLTIKKEFIEAVLDDKITFKGNTKLQVIKQIQTTLESHVSNEDGDKLLRLNIMSLTKELVTELEKQIKQANKELKFWRTTSPKKQFASDLEEI